LSARVRVHVRSCGISCGQSGTGAACLRVLRFPLSILIPQIASQSSSINRGWYNRPISGRRTKWTGSRPTPRTIYECNIKASIPILQCLNLTVISMSTGYQANIYCTLRNGVALILGKPMAVSQVRRSGKVGNHSCKGEIILDRKGSSVNQYLISLKSANYFL
jgi:hypothetical protein